MSHADIIEVHGSNKSTSLKSEKQKNGLSIWSNFKKSSRTSSVSSLISDGRYSCVSNITGFEEELQAIRLALNGSNLDDSTKLLSEESELVRKVIDLNNQLIKFKTENEKLKFEFYENDSGWKFKFKDVLDDNNRLKKVIEEMEALKKLFTNQKYENESLKNQLESLGQEHQKISLELIQTRTSYQDVLMKLQSKESGINALKNKIKELHCEVQDEHLKALNQGNFIEKINNELEILKKSESWYKSELHISQISKRKFQEKLILSESENLNERNKSGRLKSDIRTLLKSCELLEAKTLEDKKNLMKKIQEFQSNVTLSKNHQTDFLTEVKIDELTKQLEGIKSEFSNQSKQFTKIEIDNKNLLSNLAVAQKTVSDKELLLQLQEDSLRKFKENLNSSNLEIENLRKEKYLLKDENIKKTVELKSLKSEKKEIDFLVEKLRSDFKIIYQRYILMKDELQEKIISLQENDFLNKKLKDDFQLKVNTQNNDFNDKLNKIEKLTAEYNEIHLKFNDSEKNNSKLNKYLKDLNEANYKLNDFSKKFNLEKLNLEKSVFDLKNDLGILKTENDSLQIKIKESIKLNTTNWESSENTIVHDKKSIQSEVEGSDECLRLKVLIKVLEKEHREKLKRFEIIFYFFLFCIHFFVEFYVCHYFFLTFSTNFCYEMFLYI